MNRETKFRAWDRLNKRWLDVSSLSMVLGKINGVWELREGDNELYGLHQVQLCKYTGLHDRNGKEIYEDYIVSNGLQKGLVVFDRTAQFMVRVDSSPLGDDHSTLWPIYDFLFDDSNDEGKAATVLGTIYENPELLTNTNGVST